ncbi:MAG TPA: efflux transporter outer membrane subunit [Bryobacteraceae bacterium]|jgi:multidrug efflux system outer membrane protein|nr:efflux transporter outer membrane subunit [Bryobacteraceae bacterium]
MKIRVTAVLIAAGWAAGCTVGPNYQRPAVKIPQDFRAPDPLPAPQATSLADLKWWEVFRDEKLQELIRTALTANYDLRDAVARVEEAQANLGITRSNQLPQMGVSGDVQFNRLSRDGNFQLPPSFAPSQNRTWGEGMLNLLSFEVDIWGRLRRATEASRANLLSAEENRKAVVVTLVSDVASDYLHLRELDYELQISRATLTTRQDSLNLTQQRQTGGVATLLDLRQAEQLVDTAEQTIPELQRQIEQTENQITLLLGQSPGGIARGQDFMNEALPPGLPPDVPAGMPSALLERRPDILAAEQNLVAANANIGVAKAEYFPRISLSGFLGGQSTQLSSLFTGPHSAWSFVPQVSQPVFAAGRLKSGVRLAQAERDEALVQYERTIQTAFTDVSDALIAHQRVRESRLKQETLVRTLEDRTRLAYARYRGGVDTQLNALDADRDLFQAQLSLAEVRLNELLSVVQLYKALGGGWS